MTRFIKALPPRAGMLGALALSAVAPLTLEAQVKRLSPVLVVDAIEPVLPFWIDRLGFEKKAEVPAGGSLGFVILARDGVEIMYQTRASMSADLSPLADWPTGGTMLFIEVKDVDATERALRGIEPVMPRRKTFYGADEIVVRDPAGNVLIFAEFADSGTEG